MNHSEAAISSLQAEERYRLLVDAIIDYAVYMLDPNGVVISWNTGAQRFKGYTEKEILGSHFSKFYTDSDRDLGLPAYGLDTASREGRFETEGWRVRKDGTHFWAHVVIDPIRTAAGELLGFAKVTRDLTQKKAAEEALRESESQLRLLIEGVTDYAIYLISTDGLVTNWNAGAQRIKGYQAVEVIGKHFSLFYTHEDRAAGRPQANLTRAARNGRMEEEGWRLRKDGTIFMAHVVIDAIRDQSGALSGFAKVTRDVTERYETQKALDQAREELFQAQKMDAVGRLTGGVAHDFNNLLTVILISLRLARKRLADTPVMQLIDNAVTAAERGASMTQRMLAFSRSQSLRLEAISVPDLVFSMRTLVEQSIGANISIDTRFPLGLPSVYADGHQLEMALLNLVLNARDAMPNGGGIVISARISKGSGDTDESEPERCIVLEVTDSGEGMDKETLDKAIEPFFTTKGIGKGTGLGLSMVHGIVEQIGGKLKLHSTRGKGTTVQLWLPIAEDWEPEIAPEEETRVYRGASTLQILVVDDDELVLLNTCALLEELGHRTLAARSAAEALDILSKAEVELVITDHAMPDITGMQLIKILTQTRPNLPVVLASGYQEIEERADFEVQRLSKPFDEASLAKVIGLAIVNSTNLPFESDPRH